MARRDAVSSEWVCAWMTSSEWIDFFPKLISRTLFFKERDNQKATSQKITGLLSALVLNLPCFSLPISFSFVTLYQHDRFSESSPSYSNIAVLISPCSAGRVFFCLPLPYLSEGPLRSLPAIMAHSENLMRWTAPSMRSQGISKGPLSIRVH